MSPRRSSLRLLLGVATALLLAVVGGLAIALPSIEDLPRMQALLRSEASRLLDRPVRFERVSLSYWPLPAVRVVRLVVANAPGFGPDPLLSVEEARVRVRLLPLLRGRLQFGEVTLRRPSVVVEQRRDGAWNLPAPGATRPAPAAPLVAVSRVRLREGHVEIRVPGEAGRPVVAHLVDRIDVTLDDLGWSQPIRFKLGARLPGGGLIAALEGEAGPLAQAGGDLAAVPARFTARLTAEEAPVPADALFTVSGRGDGLVRAEGTLGQMAGSGQLGFARITIAHRGAACPPGPPRQLTLEAVELPIKIAGPIVTVMPFALRVGGGTVRGNAALGWSAGTPGVELTAVELQGVSAQTLLVDFLCQPYAVTGRMGGLATLAFTGTGDDLLRSARGTWQVQVGPGRLVGPAMLTLLSGALRVGSVLHSVVNLDLPRSLDGSPLEFQSLAATGSVGTGRLVVSDATMVNPVLRVTGRGSYGLIDTRLDFNVNVESGRTRFGVKVGGTAGQPAYGPTPGLRGSDVVKMLEPLMGIGRRAPSRPAPPSGNPASR
ncbi:MAG TPA: AsmA-like C-terminal region-containing protein [Methylomirabilota bacterium]|nr:AsmA-like C-terminal region-containing protein [Methylomirabilota bacterium]